MTKELRIVVDTNVLISAALAERSTSRRAIFAAIDNATLLLSDEVLDEMGEVLRRKKFDKYLPHNDRVLFLRSVMKGAEFIKVTSRITDCPDPNDNKFLELAVDGYATHLITGDGDLLDMNPYNDIIILTGSDFLKEVKKN